MTSANRRRTALLAAVLVALLPISSWAETTPPPLLPPGKPLVPLPDFRPILKRYEDAVVKIEDSSTKIVGGHVVTNPFPKGSPFYRFFQNFPGYQPPAKEQMQALGSGFIISPNGYIVTAGHVVRGMHHIVVTLYNHKAYPAKIVGLSVQYDTALLKIDAHHLPTVQLGNANDLKVGQWLLAVGMPFGFYYTVTQGVVSAMDRPLPHDDPYIPFIQSDVPINPGNSGGPIFNMSGQVVGINDQIYTNDGGYMGLSFSVPINTAMRAVDAFMEHKKLQFGWLGVMVQDVTPPLARALHLKEPIGALISEVMPHDAAARARLKTGEVIITYNGKPIYNVGQLPPMVGDTAPGTVVPIGILDHGRAETIDVRIGTMPEKMRYHQQKALVTIHKLDISVGPLTPSDKKRLNIRHGVVVHAVYPGPASMAGVVPGMAIQEINGHTVRNPEQLQQLVNSLPTHTPIAMRVREGRNSLFIVVTLGG